MPKPTDGIDHRLLGVVMHNPHGALKAAMSLGLAIGTELCHRKQSSLLRRMTADRGLHDSAIAAALDHWADVSRDGMPTETQFQRLCDKIADIASAS